MAGADLHIHSIWSDGLVRPSEIARQANLSSLSYISLTDHNILTGVEVLVRCMEGSSIRVIPGVEITVYDGRLGEIHILGYGIDTTEPRLRGALEKTVLRKRQQLAHMIHGLAGEGVHVSDEELRLEAGPGYVGRNALARVLVRKGAVGSVYQAFRRYLGEEGKLYTPVAGMKAETAIDLIHGAGGLAVLAHPTMDMLDAGIRRFAEHGLDGIEVYRPGAGGNEELYAEMVAKDFGLLLTGGSDWHGRRRDGKVGRFSIKEKRISAFLERIGRAADGPERD